MILRKIALVGIMFFIMMSSANALSCVFEPITVECAANQETLSKNITCFEGANCEVIAYEHRRAGKYPDEPNAYIKSLGNNEAQVKLPNQDEFRIRQARDVVNGKFVTKEGKIVIPTSNIFEEGNDIIQVLDMVCMENTQGILDYTKEYKKGDSIRIMPDSKDTEMQLKAASQDYNQCEFLQYGRYGDWIIGKESVQKHCAKVGSTGCSDVYEPAIIKGLIFKPVEFLLANWLIMLVSLIAVLFVILSGRFFEIIKPTKSSLIVSVIIFMAVWIKFGFQRDTWSYYAWPLDKLVFAAIGIYIIISIFQFTYQHFRGNVQ